MATNIKQATVLVVENGVKVVHFEESENNGRILLYIGDKPSGSTIPLYELEVVKQFTTDNENWIDFEHNAPDGVPLLFRTVARERHAI